ncbi:MAG: hypothetical protein LBQ22_09070 [Bacteroidales bacterium]|jgi:predicted GTPase|nr:hypothetical protein [Bacteroidales bacterium]
MEIRKQLWETPANATPTDINRLIRINKTSVKMGYELQEIGSPNLKEVVIYLLRCVKLAVSAVRLR